MAEGRAGPLPTRSRPLDPSEEVAVLRREVAVLKRTVEVLVELLVQADAFDTMDGAQVRRRLSRAAQDAREQLEEGEKETPEPTTAQAQSAYRGALPGAAGRGCAICRKPLGEDDPELVAGSAGRVCVMCFQRNPGR